MFCESTDVTTASSGLGPPRARPSGASQSRGDRGAVSVRAANGNLRILMVALAPEGQIEQSGPPAGLRGHGRMFPTWLISRPVADARRQQQRHPADRAPKGTYTP